MATSVDSNTGLWVDPNTPNSLIGSASWGGGVAGNLVGAATTGQAGGSAKELVGSSTAPTTGGAGGLVGNLISGTNNVGSPSSFGGANNGTGTGNGDVGGVVPTGVWSYVDPYRTPAEMSEINAHAQAGIAASLASMGKPNTSPIIAQTGTGTVVTTGAGTTGGTKGSPSEIPNTNGRLGGAAPTTSQGAGGWMGGVTPPPPVPVPVPAPAPTGGGGGGYATGGVTNWNVTPNQTVAATINGLVDPNSPLIQQARTQALQNMATRGLTNSSMAETAGMDAAYKAALPIAQQDATTYATAAQANAGASNNLNLQGMQLNTNMGIAELQARTQASNNANSIALAGMNNLSAQQIAQMNNATALTQTGMNNASALGITNLNNLSAQQIAQLNATTSLTQTGMNNATTLTQTGLNNANALGLANINNLSAQQIAMLNNTASIINTNTNARTSETNTNTNARTSETNTKANNTTSTNIANANNENQIRQQSSNITINANNQIANIQSSTTMDAKSKNAAIANIRLITQGSLEILDAGGKLGLGTMYTNSLKGMPGFDDTGHYVGFDADGNTKGTKDGSGTSNNLPNNGTPTTPTNTSPNNYEPKGS